MRKSNAWFACPNCGKIISGGSPACPNCGSDENTGWSENTYLDGVDLPFDEDEYEEFKAKEFSDGKIKGNSQGMNWRMAVGIIVIAAMLLMFVFK